MLAQERPNNQKPLDRELSIALNKEKLERLKEQLAELIGGRENVEEWLKSPHPMLGKRGERTPESYINVEKGNFKVLEYFIYAIAQGQVS